MLVCFGSLREHATFAMAKLLENPTLYVCFPIVLKTHMPTAQSQTIIEIP